VSFDRTPAGGAEAAPAPAPTECPCCRLHSDRPREDVGACLGIALVFVHGADSVRTSLCATHKRIVQVFVETLRIGGCE
jgi:hypothetical protein